MFFTRLFGALFIVFSTYNPTGWSLSEVTPPFVDQMHRAGLADAFDLTLRRRPAEGMPASAADR